MSRFRPLYTLLLIGCSLLFRGSAVVCAQQTIAEYTNQPVYDFRPGNPDFGSGPAYPVGALAPDFAVPEIQSLLKSDANAVTKVQLSSYRGKRPVVLICSGYT